MTTADMTHDRTVTAFFDTRAAATKAEANVIASGVPASMVSVVEGNDPNRAGAATMTTSTSQEGGFWGSVKNMFAPEEDKHAYAEGLSRGGYLLTAHTDEAHYDRVIDILDDEGAVDMNERETQWKSEGWSGRHDAAPAVGSTMAAARGLETPVAYRQETSTAATLGTAAPAEDLTGTTASRTMPVAETAVGARGTGLGDETIQLAEETMRVGKRDVAHGRVRLRSYVVEKPVTESVTLHSETVDVSRRPVSRALGAGENLFQERTISAEGHHEEAVVSKEARVYEEVGLNRTATDRTEEIKDTVRRTELEVDDATLAAGGAVRGTGASLERPIVATGGTAAADMHFRIVEHMDVLASDGEKVGTVDHMDGTDRVKLTKSASADGMHHFIPTSWIARVDEHLHLNKPAATVRNDWM